MKFCEDSSLERGLDTMFMVYSLLDGHPASTVCEQFITSRQEQYLHLTIGIYKRHDMLT